MSELAKIAALFRSVRARETEFLGRFAAEILFDRPIFLDGMLADLDRYDTASTAAFSPELTLGRRHHPEYPTERA